MTEPSVCAVVATVILWFDEGVKLAIRILRPEDRAPEAQGIEAA